MGSYTCAAGLSVWECCCQWFSPGAAMMPRVQGCCYIMAPSLAAENQAGCGGGERKREERGGRCVTAYLQRSGSANRKGNNLVGSVHAGTSLH